jgi:hypothetical protein
MAFTPEMILVFLGSLLTSLIPALVILWRWSSGEARKMAAETNGSRADAAQTWRAVAAETAEDLRKARKRIEYLEGYVRQLIRVIELGGGIPPRPKEPEDE